MLYNNIYIDISNYYKKAYSVLGKDYVIPQERIHATISLTCKMILKIKREQGSDNCKVFILADNPTSKQNFRKLIDSEYKAGRVPESDGYYRGIDFVLLIFNNFSEEFSTARVKDAEADDLVKPLLELVDPKEFNLLCSEDMDWARMISDNTHWYAKGMIFDPKEFKEKYEFYPSISSIALWKTFRGDSSDNIPNGLPNLPTQTLLEWLNKYSTIYDVFKALESNTLCGKNPWFERLHENKTRLFKNFELVSFQNISKEEMKETLIPGHFRKETLRSYYESLKIDYSFDPRIKKEKYTLEEFGFDSYPRR